jgi:hypothetical protein
MSDYHIVTLTLDGPSSARHFACDNDGDAIVWAEQQLDQRPLELWSGKRLVRRLSPNNPNRAVTLKVSDGRLVAGKSRS